MFIDENNTKVKVKKLLIIIFKLVRLNNECCEDKFCYLFVVSSLLLCNSSYLRFLDFIYF